jgi:hypothetical protein
VEFWSMRYFNAAAIKRIQSLCDGESWPDNERMPNNPIYCQKFTMQQPTDAVFEFLDEIPDMYGLLITRVDFALDFITRTKKDAKVVQKFFDMHAVKRWPGKRQIGWLKRTKYSAKPEKGETPPANVTAGYSDLTSKTDGKPPCYHHEWKCFRAEAVRRVGVNCFWDLAVFDHHTFWERNLRLFEWDYGRLGRVLKRTRRKKARDGDARVGRSLEWMVRARPNRGTDYEVGAGVDEVLRVAVGNPPNGWGLDSVKVRRCLKPISTESFLPE